MVYGLSKRGFFSEVNMLVCNYAFALAASEDFYLDDERFIAPWANLFVSPLRSRRDLDPDRYDRVAVSDLKAGEKEWRRRRQWVIEACEEERRARIESLAFEGTWRELLFLVSKVLFQPAQAIVDLAQSKQAELGLEPGRFCAVHVRRGDKTQGKIRNGVHFAEGEAIPFQAYVDALARLAPGTRRIFMMTDDHREVLAARRDHPELEILTLCPPEEGGYHQERYREMSEKARRQAVWRLMAETLIAARSQAFAGLYLSNVSLMLTALHPRPELCVSVDSQVDWLPVR